MIPPGLGPAHRTRDCAVCRENRRAVVDVSLVIAIGALLALLLSAWFLS